MCNPVPGIELGVEHDDVDIEGLMIPNVLSIEPGTPVTMSKK